MFIIITTLTLALLLYLTLCNWMHATRRTPHKIQKIARAASQYVLLGKWQEAHDLIAPFIENGEQEIDRIHIHVLRGTHRLKEGLEKAIACSGKYPEDLFFKLEEGLILLALDRAAEALEAFRVSAPIMRTETGALALATALNRTGEPTQAFEYLEPWIAETRNGELLALAGETFLERKCFSEAIQHFRRAMEYGYQTHHLFTQLAHAYRRLGNLAEAEKIFRTLLKRDGGDLVALLGLGLCLQERGHDQKALLTYQSSAAWERKDPRLLKEAGLCALRIKRYACAELYLGEIAANNEADPSLLASYALSLENQNKWQEAEQVYLRLVALYPSHPQGYRALAWLFGVGLSKTLSHEQGISFAHIAMKLKNDAISWEILSACEARAGNFEKAYAIQMELAKQDQSREERIRRSQVLRHLRMHHPLAGHQVTRSLVA